MVLTSGAKIGPYEVLSPLGAGGMGEGYRARDTRLDREVATLIRKTDGSSLTHLGDGMASWLSPDGNWAIAALPSTPSQIVLLPTGAGSSKSLERYNTEIAFRLRGLCTHE